MAAKRSKRQLQEIADLLRHVYAEGGYGTWAEFAADADVHPTQVSGFQNADAEPSGYSLFKLLRAASKRSGIPAERLVAQPDEESLSARMDAALENQDRMWVELERIANAVRDIEQFLRPLAEAQRSPQPRRRSNG